MFKDTAINENKSKKKIGTKQVEDRLWEKTDYGIKGKRKSNSIFKYFKNRSCISSCHMVLNQDYHRYSAFSKFCS